MLLHIANLMDSERFTAQAATAIPLGSVVYVSGMTAGVRQATIVASAADLKNGLYGVAFAVSTDPEQVTESTVPASWGSRVVSIATGDYITMVMPGAIIEYDASLLDDTLNPAEGGTLPAVGDALELLSGKFCTVAAAGIAAPIVGRVFDVFGNKVQIKLIDADTIA